MLNRAQLKQSFKQSLAQVKLGRGGRGRVLLTFDDGPHAEYTPAILRLLGRYDARAVFFVVGRRIDRAPHLLRAILEEGHALGNHSYEHPLEGQPWLPGYLKDLRRCQRRIEELTGYTPTLFRPPLGRLSLASVVAPRLLGLRTMLWSLDSGDWQLWGKDEAAARDAAERLASRVRRQPPDADIILLHDDHPHVLPVLESLLPALAEGGLDLRAALDEVTGDGGTRRPGAPATEARPAPAQDR